MPRISIVHVDRYSRESILQVGPIFKTDEESLLCSDKWLINVFCYHTAENMHFPDPFVITTLFVSNIVVEATLNPPIKAEDDVFSYHLHAIVHDKHNALVRMGDIFLLLDMPLPKDINNGNIISFDVVRLDWWNDSLLSELD